MNTDKVIQAAAEYQAAYARYKRSLANPDGRERFEAYQAAANLGGELLRLAREPYDEEE